MGRRLAVIIAAMASAIPIVQGLQDNEQNLVKLLFYPLAFRCLFDKLFEKGWLRKFKHGDIIGYVIANIFITFTYQQER